MHKKTKDQRPKTKVYAVILVGGKGKRLRPLSTDARPKAFLSVTKDRKTMFARTIERIEDIIPGDNIIIVANKAHSRLVRKDLPGLRKENLLLEPVSRNTAPAVALAARVIKKRSDDAVMVILPTDQYIMDEKKYLDSIGRAIDFVVKNKDVFMILAVKPKYPDTGFGYLKFKSKGKELKRENIFKVEKFIEKPGLNIAKRFVKSGRYLWNTGVFLFRASTILEAVRKFAPKIYHGLKNLSRIGSLYERLPDISLDYAVIEKTPNIYCIEGSYRWQDMGSFENLQKILKMESRSFVLEDGKVVAIL